MAVSKSKGVVKTTPSRVASPKSAPKRATGGSSGDSLSKPKLEKFRLELVTKRDSLATELLKATTEFIEDDSAYADSVDQAAAEVDKSLQLQMKNRERGILQQIDEALRRIEAGTFGVCSRCSEAISEARLRASLLTNLCIECKGEIENEDNRFANR